MEETETTEKMKEMDDAMSILKQFFFWHLRLLIPIWLADFLSNKVYAPSKKLGLWDQFLAFHMDSYADLVQICNET